MPDQNLPNQPQPPTFPNISDTPSDFPQPQPTAPTPTVNVTTSVNTEPATPEPQPADTAPTMPETPPPPPPMIATPVKPKGRGKILATILGLLLLVGAVGAGVVLVGQKQLFRQKAGIGDLCITLGDPICVGNVETGPCYEEERNGQTYKCHKLTGNKGKLIYGSGIQCDFNGGTPVDCECPPSYPWHAFENGADWCFDTSSTCDGEGCYSERCVVGKCGPGPTNTPGPTSTPTPTPPPGSTPTPTPTRTPTPSPAPTPFGCNSSNCHPGQNPDGCAPGLFCYQWSAFAWACRKPECPTVETCDCNAGPRFTPTPTPTRPPGATPTPTPTRPPGATPTPTIPPSCPVPPQCGPVRVYDTNWNPLSAAQLSTLKPGNKVRFTISANLEILSMDIDKARFTINGIKTGEVTAKKPGTQEFYYEYTIPSGVTDFTIEGELHSVTWGWFGIGSKINQ